ncbi:hypothetical protein H0H81_011841 [Sphagnurus paluster]|uniref:Uncharacterized protein n=1 Tax=Sphagnurus paluster TaxID=117069 RepID=A0A9P7K3E2_9AGAR|nr:hypothetical protein H0H81_011841 [Sphagnurus paluster]
MSERECTHIKGYVASELEHIDLNKYTTSVPGDCIWMEFNKIEERFENIPDEKQAWDLSPAMRVGGTQPVLVAGLCYVEGEPEPELPLELTESFDPGTPIVKLRLWEPAE